MLIVDVMTLSNRVLALGEYAGTYQCTVLYPNGDIMDKGSFTISVAKRVCPQVSITGQSY